jgi:Cathepsin propeptide inhibitor domain (I29)
LTIIAREIIKVDDSLCKRQVKYQKSYTPEENAKRFEIFKKNFASIQEQNRKYEQGLSTFTSGVNNFADRTPEEMRRSMGLAMPESEENAAPPMEPANEAPASEPEAAPKGKRIVCSIVKP